MKTRTTLAVIIAAIASASCSQDSCREYSKYTCSELERKDYNVLVYPRNDDGDRKEYFAGEVTGLQACESTAHGYAAEHHFESSSDWSYICCLKTDDSSCEEKHR